MKIILEISGTDFSGYGSETKYMIGMACDHVTFSCWDSIYRTWIGHRKSLPQEVLNRLMHCGTGCSSALYERCQVHSGFFGWHFIEAVVIRHHSL